MNFFDEIKFVCNIDDNIKNILKSIDSKLLKINISDNQRKKNLIINSKVRYWI